MGLAAQQARLLTITSRKSDCEYRAMGLSHEKISLARDMVNISNEYQNSLDQTKLIYDYYGTGDQQYQLNYGLMYTPSALNNYSPITLTNAQGRIVLDSKYAYIAKSIGIPQEGLNGLPSDAMRNAWVEGLRDRGIITPAACETIKACPYNQLAGVGGKAGDGYLVSELVKKQVADADADPELTYKDLVTALLATSSSKLDLTSFSKVLNDAAKSGITWGQEGGKTGAVIIPGSSETKLDLYKLLTGDQEAYATVTGQMRKGSTVGHKQDWPEPGELNNLQNILVNNTDTFLTWMYNEFANVLDIGDGVSGNALDYALMQVQDIILKKDNYHQNDISRNANLDYSRSEANKNAKNYLGAYIVKSNARGSWTSVGYASSTASISLNNLAESFLTYFAQFLEGSTANSTYDAKIGKKDGQALVTNDADYLYKIATDWISSDDNRLANGWDKLFNQICTNGWLENDNVQDPKYMQNMLQNGMMFLGREKDDGFYYQGNYATDKYIKVMADDTAIAQAEAKYNTAKQKVNQKEQVLDLKLKNLDTEISALTTEYDSVKSVIGKQIEKSFKRYG